MIFIMICNNERKDFNFKAISLDRKKFLVLLYAVVTATPLCVCKYLCMNLKNHLKSSFYSPISRLLNAFLIIFLLSFCCCKKCRYEGTNCIPWMRAEWVRERRIINFQFYYTLSDFFFATTQDFVSLKTFLSSPRFHTRVCFFPSFGNRTLQFS
jgi:hypothetical protein